LNPKDLIGYFFKSNILHIIHERAARDIPIGFSKVILVLETRGPEHIHEIEKRLKTHVQQVKAILMDKTQ
jgi:hypothetical protein